MLDQLIRNHLIFERDFDSPHLFQEMLSFMDGGGDPFFRGFDFEQLIPMPEELDVEDCPELWQGLELYQEFMQANASQSEEKLGVLEQAWQSRMQIDPTVWTLGKQAYENLQKYGDATWYDWCARHWGCSWNAFSSHVLSKYGMLEFFTCGSAAAPVIRKLSEKYPTQVISYSWAADKEPGHITGEMQFKNGEIIDCLIPEDESRDAYEIFSCMCGVNLKDYGLYLKEDESGYEYRGGETAASRAQLERKQNKGRGER